MDIRRIRALMRALHGTAHKIAHQEDREQLFKTASLLKTALNEYQQHFQDKMKEHGITSIKGEDPAKIGPFFEDMKSSWNEKKNGRVLEGHIGSKRITMSPGVMRRHKELEKYSDSELEDELLLRKQMSRTK